MNQGSIYGDARSKSVMVVVACTREGDGAKFPDRRQGKLSLGPVPERTI